MDTQLIMGLFALAQASVAASPTLPTPVVKAEPAVAVTTPPVPTNMQVARCDARPWQRLVGRTVSDLLTTRLPPNTRIYRLDDPPQAAISTGRLSVELNRSTRVRRVYCS